MVTYTCFENGAQLGYFECFIMLDLIHHSRSNMYSVKTFALKMRSEDADPPKEVGDIVLTDHKVLTFYASIGSSG